MTKFFSLLADGLALGAVYALVALGFVVIFRATGVINFAQGGLVVFGAFLVYQGEQTWGWPFWVSALFAMVCVAAIGAAFEGLVLRRMIGQPIFAIILITIGLSWAIAGVVAVVAGMMLAGGAGPAPGLSVSLAVIALRAFPAIILGGLDSPGGAVVGGLIIGVAEVMTKGYIPDLIPSLGPEFGDIVPYLIMLVILLVRPFGLFGTPEVRRV